MPGFLLSVEAVVEVIRWCADKPLLLGRACHAWTCPAQEWWARCMLVGWFVLTGKERTLLAAVGVLLYYIRVVSSCVVTGDTLPANLGSFCCVLGKTAHVKLYIGKYHIIVARWLGPMNCYMGVTFQPKVPLLYKGLYDSWVSVYLSPLPWRDVAACLTIRARNTRRYLSLWYDCIALTSTGTPWSPLFSEVPHRRSSILT